ncbi:MAG: hypothetical protein KGQ79_09070 [Proteobacteria bacterium]|nr:hypothetical protein [Pseudomonadota bacterium]MBU6426357.1 hypothetical protein [Rhodospirillales bacterium]
MKDFRSALSPVAAMASLLTLAACGGAYIVNGTTTMTHATGITKAGADSALRTTNVVAAPATASADNTASAGGTVSTPSSGSSGGGINFTVVNTTGPVSTANKAGAASTVSTAGEASAASTTAPANTANTPGPTNTVSMASPVSTPSPASAMPADPTTYCPQVAALQQAQTVTLFLPGRSDVASQITTAQLTSVSGNCVYRKKGKAGILKVTFTNNFLADNGPANNGQPITLPWFVAITNGDQIIEKKDYQITLKFNGNMSTTAATSKPVKIELAAVPASADVQILTGFEMTPDQLAYAAAHPNAVP